LNRNGGSTSLFDAFSSREPVSTSLENALGSFTFPAGIALHCDIRSSTIAASDGGRRSLNKAPDQTIGQSRP
jgi:hypothetical protein